MRNSATGSTVGAIATSLLLAFGFAQSCKKQPEATQASADTGALTPEQTFDQVKKALVNRDADLMWDLLSKGLSQIFDDGRKEMMRRPIEEQQEIAAAGMTTVAQIHEMNTKNFFKFYFEYKKRELYSMTSAKMLEWRVQNIRDAKVEQVRYEGDPQQATKAVVHFIMAEKPYVMPMVKENGRWLIDSMDQADALAPAVEVKPSDKLPAKPDATSAPTPPSAPPEGGGPAPAQPPAAAPPAATGQPEAR